jgi:hypothetical protein
MENASSATPVDCIVMPRLINRGDGVNGHFCIGRSKDGVFYEFWSDREGWCSAGMVYIGQEAAEAKLKEVTAMKQHSYRPFTTRDGSQACAECYGRQGDPIHAVCDRCDGDGKAHGSDRPFEWSGPGTYPGPCPVCKGSGTKAEA